jgi:hypothetical protein
VDVANPRNITLESNVDAINAILNGISDVEYAAITIYGELCMLQLQS